MNTYNTLTLGAIVSDNYKAASIFEKHGIDFCCQGNRNFSDACKEAGLDAEKIAKEIDELTVEPNTAVNFKHWPLDVLADHIFKNHHQYIEQVTPTIKNLLLKICNVHGSRHPELLEIQEIFNTTTGELAVHMKKEELILFPFIKKLFYAKEKGVPTDSTLFRSVASPIQKMNEDHLDEGAQLAKMAELSNNFTPPEDACITYQTTYKLLKEYEKDMHLHIHLENNILFPRALEIERELVQKA
ncbi:MAG: iron-sulfur cluster repair di-iron protein [Cyclobacteriaceae bacterium]